MQKQRPILYSTPMVIAVQREVNPKTQTRRTKGLEKINENPSEYTFWQKATNSDFYLFESKNNIREVKCPYGNIGDLLWVRESFYKHPQNGDNILYKADYENFDEFVNTGWKLKPSIHMPKVAARIWLQITDIKIERLKDISEADAIAEGVEPVDGGYKNYMTEPKMLKKLNYWTKAYFSFLSLWESINGYESSELNPWVWVITFKRINYINGDNISAAQAILLASDSLKNVEK